MSGSAGKKVHAALATLVESIMELGSDALGGAVEHIEKAALEIGKVLSPEDQEYLILRSNGVPLKVSALSILDAVAEATHKDVELRQITAVVCVESVGLDFEELVQATVEDSEGVLDNTEGNDERETSTHEPDAVDIAAARKAGAGEG